tara:strand:+ start:167 stop:427 length:261 start_codon:yes stop_codon:yes gene_type:complete
MPRDYKREYETYHKSAKQKKRRAARNGARRKMEKAGRVRKGDGKDVDHKNHNPHDNGTKNLKVMSKGRNRAKNLGKGGRPKASKKK